MPSDRLQLLHERIEQLRQHLLPPEFEPIGSYPNEEGVTVKALSFRMLAHAEIEAYFEDRVIQIAKAAWSAWETEQHVSRTALYLLAFCGREMQRPPHTLAAPTKNKQKSWVEMVDIRYRLRKAVSDYIRDVMEENHGIREKNILALLLPIGLSHTTIDEILLTNINEFGKLRGEAAHSSTAFQVRQGVDPKEEYDRVQNIVASLSSIDEELDSVLSTTNTTLAKGLPSPLPPPSPQ